MKVIREARSRNQAYRRALIEGGMDGEKVMRVIGLASAAPLDRDDLFAPINRRISIIVMKKEAEKAASRDGTGISLPY